MSMFSRDLPPTTCSFAKPYAPDLHDIEEEIIFSSNGNEANDDEDILLAIEPCIHFGTQMFPHHDGIFLQVSV